MARRLERRLVDERSIWNADVLALGRSPRPIDKRPARPAPHFVIRALLAEERQRSRALRHSELLSLDFAPRQECRSRRRPTVRAVADKRRDELVGHLILDGMAGAAPFQHTDSLEPHQAVPPSTNRRRSAAGACKCRYDQGDGVRRREPVPGLHVGGVLDASARLVGIAGVTGAPRGRLAG
jgi:hypothetical protein